MKCDEYKEHILDLILEQVSGPAEMELRSHALACDECQREYDAMKKVQTAVDGLPDIEPSADLAERILARNHAQVRSSYSDRLRAISKDNNTSRYMLRWFLLQISRPEVSLVTIAAVVIIGFFSTYYTWFQPDHDDVSRVYDLSRLPEQQEFEDYTRRTSIAVLRARDELLELEDLDVPELTWKNTEFDLALAGPEEIDPAQIESEIVKIQETPVLAAVPTEDTAIAYAEIDIPLFSYRFQRDQALAYYEGEDVRGLVEDGLRWLAHNQNDNGSWGKPSHRQFITGLAGLCLLADIHHLQSLDMRDNLDQAAAYVYGQSSPDGFFGGDDQQGRRGHLVALNFLVEYAALTSNRAMQKGITAGLRTTFDMGAAKGWDSAETRFKADSALPGWYILLMESARRCGYDVDRLYRDRARSWIVQATYGGAERGTRNYEDDLVRKATAFMGRYFMDEKLEKKDLPAIAAGILADLEDMQAAEVDDINPYLMYFGSLGMFQYHGSEWYLYNVGIKNYLAHSSLKAEYYGENIGTYWPAKDRRYAENGDTFYTAISVLTLQSYYRYRVLHK